MVYLTQEARVINMGRHTQYLKEFDIKEHKLMFGGIGACILLMIIGAIIGVFAHANMQGAANDYDSVNKTVTNIVQDQRVSNTIRYIHTTFWIFSSVKY